MQSKKITYKDIKILREKINQQSGVEVIKEHWVNPRVNITTGKTISMVVSLYLNSKFLYDEEFVKELKKSCTPSLSHLRKKGTNSYSCTTLSHTILTIAHPNLL